MSESADDWFVREVLPHEAALLRYLARVWPNPADIQDIRHDAYVRILEGAERLRPIAPKSLLFTTARNLMIDRARRNRIVPIDLRGDLDFLNVLVDEITPERRASIRQQLMNVSAAFNRLPEKCREVLWLRRVESLSQKEIAAKLRVSEGTVEKHMMRAARLLTNLLSQPETVESETSDSRATEEGGRRGQ
ncbi:MAG: sigma-70 family RNA polymerase sigma factor [Gammaproteobacteria bacterium]